MTSPCYFITTTVEPSQAVRNTPPPWINGGPDYITPQIPGPDGHGITSYTVYFILLGPGGTGNATCGGGSGSFFYGSYTMGWGNNVYINLPNGGGETNQATWFSLNNPVKTPLPDPTNPYYIPYCFSGMNGNEGGAGGYWAIANGATSPGFNTPGDITILDNANGGAASGTAGGACPITFLNSYANLNGAVCVGGNPNNYGSNGLILISSSPLDPYYTKTPFTPVQSPQNYNIPWYYTGPGDYNFTVPDVNGNGTPVDVHALLEGGGGGGSPNPGGSGAVMELDVSLPIGTTVYLHLPGGTGDTNGTFISLTPPPPGGFTGPPPAGNGISYCSPYVMAGDDGDGSGPGAGGRIWTNDGTATPVLQQLANDGSITATYTPTIAYQTLGNVGTTDTTSPVWSPPAGFTLGYLEGATNLSTLIPTTCGTGAINSARQPGLVLITFNTYIPPNNPTVDNVRCFPKGTTIMTPEGYKAVETLEQGSLVTTAANKVVAIKNVYSRTIQSTNATTAPYLIPKHSFGASPTADLRLSPLHAFQIKKGLWQIPKYAALSNKAIQQYGLGESVTYYHVECPNFFTDNLIVDGTVVESFAANQAKGLKTLYKYNPALKGFTRAAQPSLLTNKTA